MNLKQFKMKLLYIQVYIYILNRIKELRANKYLQFKHLPSVGTALSCVICIHVALLFLSPDLSGN